MPDTISEYKLERMSARADIYIYIYICILFPHIADLAWQPRISTASACKRQCRYTCEKVCQNKCHIMPDTISEYKLERMSARADIYIYIYIYIYVYYFHIYPHMVCQKLCQNIDYNYPTLHHTTPQLACQINQKLTSGYSIDLEIFFFRLLADEWRNLNALPLSPPNGSGEVVG